MTTCEAQIFDEDGGRLVVAPHSDFPLEAARSASGPSRGARGREAGRRQFLRTVDRSRSRYLDLRPARAVLLGERSVLSAYSGLTRHSGRVAGTVFTTHAGASLPELQRRTGASVNRLLHSGGNDVARAPFGNRGSA